MRVCVVGLGKIGLPLAVQIASKGVEVRGADIASDVADAVNAGRAPFPGEHGLDQRLREVVEGGWLSASTDTSAMVRASDTVIIVVPLVVDAQGRPDFASIDAATHQVAEGLVPDTLVSYETTLPVGTLRERFVPMLEGVSGRRVGRDLFVCHSPERVFSGRVFADLRAYPKLVGGVDAASARRAVDLYEAVLDFDAREDLPRPNGVWDLGSAGAAELAKLVETTYRDVNIALANEFAVLADRLGIDLHAVIDAANSQPFSHVHRPGIAVGGHCIPVYPRFYLASHPDARLPAAAREINEAMPRYAVEMLGDALGSLEGARIVVLGAAYRGGVKETAFSGVFPTVDNLHAAGAIPLVHDPLYTEQELAAMDLAAYGVGDPVEGAILQADHPEYRMLTPEQFPGIRALVDGRNHVDARAWIDVPRYVIGSHQPIPGKPEGSLSGSAP